MKNKTNIDMSNLCKNFDSCSGSCTSCAYTIGYQDGSKETAEKIYCELCGHGTTYVKKWIKKQFGVEIEE